jgi:hypothetical protein
MTDDLLRLRAEDAVPTCVVAMVMRVDQRGDVRLAGRLQELLDAQGRRVRELAVDGDNA